MLDLVAIGQGLNAIKSAGETVKALMGMRADAKVLEKTVELNQRVISVQTALADAQAEQTALVKTIGDLEDEVARLKAWDSDKKRYSLTKFDPGVLAYALRPEAANGQPSHELCATCYDNGKKSILQATMELSMRRRVHLCANCKTKLAYGAEMPRSPQAFADTEYDPFSGR